MDSIALFCLTPKNWGQTLILSFDVVGCNDGISSELRKVTEGESSLKAIADCWAPNRLRLARDRQTWVCIKICG